MLNMTGLNIGDSIGGKLISRLQDSDEKKLLGHLSLSHEDDGHEISIKAVNIATMAHAYGDSGYVIDGDSRLLPYIESAFKALGLRYSTLSFWHITDLQ